jgi:hypothetical protein
MELYVTKDAGSKRLRKVLSFAIYDTTSIGRIHQSLLPSMRDSTLAMETRDAICREALMAAIAILAGASDGMPETGESAHVR